MSDGHLRTGDRRAAAAAWTRLRARAPRVHCLTNGVAAPITANLLLAAGAEPSMTADAHEVAAFVEGAEALLINLGMLDDGRREAIARALDVASARGIPWVLDPVMVERSPARLAFARALLDRGPAIVRANAAEIAALARDGAAGLAAEIGSVVAVTGAEDRIYAGGRVYALAGGRPVMARISGLGCALSALAAATVAVAAPVPAALAALSAIAAAAGVSECGPGSLEVALRDRLYALDAEALERELRDR